LLLIYKEGNACADRISLLLIYKEGHACADKLVNIGLALTDFVSFDVVPLEG